MDAPPVLLGLAYVILGVACLLTRSRVRARGRVVALVWLFMGVLVTANGALPVIQAVGGG